MFESIHLQLLLEDNNYFLEVMLNVGNTSQDVDLINYILDLLVEKKRLIEYITKIMRARLKENPNKDILFREDGILTLITTSVAKRYGERYLNTLLFEPIEIISREPEGFDVRKKNLFFYT